MAKTKSSRKRKGSVSKANPRSYTEMLRRDNTIPQQSVAETNRESAKKASTPATASTTGTADWGNDYDVVFSDLRQLLVISVILFVMMVALGFFL